MGIKKKSSTLESTNHKIYFAYIEGWHGNISDKFVKYKRIEKRAIIWANM